MDEILRQILSVARGMWQRRWIGLAVAWIAALVGSGAVLRMPERYEATSRIYVDTQSVLKPLLTGLAVQPDVNQQVAMLARTLITRPNLENLIRNADLSITIKSDRDREDLLDTLTREVKLTGGGRENLFNVSYRDTDPNRAQRVVQSLTTMFVDSGLGGKRRDTEAARRFIDEQIKSYEKKLEEAENRLKEFKLRNLNYTTGSGKDFFGQMTAINEDLAKVRLELRASEESREALRHELAGEDPSLASDVFATVDNATAIPELDGRIELLSKQLDELLRRYTEEHPDVIAARRQLASLQADRAKELEARKRAAAAKIKSTGGATNPVFQGIKIALAEAEANVASLQGRERELESRLVALRSTAGRVPQVEAELAQLNRDYDVLRKQYDGLVTRRESAAISEDVDATTQLADFRIIDPPRVSPKPVFPNRASLAPLALLGALGLGALVSFALSQLFPTIDTARVLRDVGQRPVLGIVSLRPNPATVGRRRISNVAFGGALSMLLIVFGSWIAWISLAVPV
ncbi:MAG TPA: XrtA system polysaccharide chain length determinant [Burkholderiaceae bacterium]|nr:XrtA system polysaccharide chain length determinant [Burkholderiaceae bacterium]